MSTSKKRYTKRRLIKGNIQIRYKNPLTDSYHHIIEDIDTFLNRDDNIMIYMNEDPIPFLMKRSYFANILFDDIVYTCKNGNNELSLINGKPKQYYYLFKLFVNYPEYRDIILPLETMDKIVNNKHINKYHIFTKGRIINTIPKINIELNNDEHSNIEEEDNIGNIIGSLSYYTDRGYSVANSYLIRTGHYNERRKIPEYANDIADIEFSTLLKFLTCCFNFGKKRITQCYNHVRIKAVERMIRDIDLAFMKIAPKTNSEGMILRRGVWEYYPYLKKVGDRMIIENYISATSHEHSEFGNKEYIIIVSPGIPYIDQRDRKIFDDVFIYSNEKEVILPKNLVAELVKIEEVEDYDNPIHTIKLTLLYESQFDLDGIICKERNLYDIKPYINRNNYSTKSAKSATKSKRRMALLTNSL
jgi:hypothetical protein